MKKPKIGEAAQVLFGFKIQEVRFLLHLLQAKAGDKVWLEKYDDVGVTYANGVTLTEQDTTSQDGNPIAQKAEKIWKTLSNWILIVKEGWIDPKQTRFVLYIPQYKKPGKLVQSIIDASSPLDAQVCLQDIEKLFWGTAPDYEKKASLATALEPHIQVIIDNPTIAEDVFINFELQLGHDVDVIDQVIDAFDNLSGFPEGPHRRVHCCEAALGYLTRKIMLILQSDDIIEIEWTDFNNEFLRKYYKKNLNSDFLATISIPPGEEEIENVVTSSPIFIEQLKKIKWPENDILTAANHYIITEQDTIGWASDLEIDDIELQEFETRLLEYWKNTKNEFEFDGLNEIAYGRKVASRCLSKDFELSGRRVAYHFTPGTYHHLADGDGDTVPIGWHPDFQTFFNKKETD